jgi:hypothetical protein
MAVHRASGVSETDFQKPAAPRIKRGWTAGLLDVLWKFRLIAFGRPPNVRPWHPRWPDFRIPFNTIRSLLGPSSRLVVISNHPVAFGRWLKRLCPQVVALDSSRLRNAGLNGDLAGGPFDIGLMIVEGNECANAATWLERAAGLLKPGALLAVLLTSDIDDVFDRHGRDVNALMPSMASSNAWLRVRTMRYVTESPLRRAVARAMLNVAKEVRLRPWMAFPLAPIGCVLVLASLACNCAALLRHTEPKQSAICSSVFLLEDAPTPG